MRTASFTTYYVRLVVLVLHDVHTNVCAIWYSYSYILQWYLYLCPENTLQPAPESSLAGTQCSSSSSHNHLLHPKPCWDTAAAAAPLLSRAGTQHKHYHYHQPAARTSRVLCCRWCLLAALQWLQTHGLLMFLVLLSYECSPELKTNLCFAIHELCWPFALGTQPPYFIHPSTLAFYTRSQYSSIPSVNPPRDFFLLFGQLTKRGVHRPDILTQRPLPIIQCFFFIFFRGCIAGERLQHAGVGFGNTSKSQEQKTEVQF